MSISYEERLDAISRALDELLDKQFLSMQDYNKLVEQNKLVKKGKWDDDFDFQLQHPDHPLNSENRGRRMRAADAIRDQAIEMQDPLPEEILDRLHTALFDCSDAVRVSIAHALFHCGSRQSGDYLERLLEEGGGTGLHRNYVSIALARCRMRDIDRLPEGKKVIMLVSKDIQLALALHELADKTGTYLYMPQYDYTELIAWSSAAAVQIIDRWLMGQDRWNTFCDYLSDVNKASNVDQIRDEDGDMLLEEPIYDHTPLIITDWYLEKSLKEFREPEKPKNKIYYIEGGPDYVVTELVEHIMQGKDFGL